MSDNGIRHVRPRQVGRIRFHCMFCDVLHTSFKYFPFGEGYSQEYMYNDSELVVREYMYIKSCYMKLLISNCYLISSNASSSGTLIGYFDSKPAGLSQINNSSSGHNI